MVALRGDHLLKFNFMTKKSKGLGDSIEKITKATGIKKVVDTVAKATGRDCGCEDRKNTLNNLLSHFLPSDSQNGEVINIDLKNYNENRETFDYFYHTYNCDTNMFNTNI